ncbi:MAG: hypothetical protein JXD23_08350 [Spirochaetales bacterium]|nr:hypothetical protein [Spirochaetales bacterium]
MRKWEEKKNGDANVRVSENGVRIDTMDGGVETTDSIIMSSHLKAVAQELN